MRNTLLSIVPGRHRIGYAIFHKGRMVFYGIGSFSNYRSRTTILGALEKFVLGILGRFGVDCVAIRDLSEHQRESKMIDEIFRHIKSICTSAPVRICIHDGISINRYFSGAGRPTNDRTANCLVVRYPELRRYHDAKQKRQLQYYRCMFQAIALGSVCLNESNPQE